MVHFSNTVFKTRGFINISVISSCFAFVSSLDAEVDYYGVWSRHRGSEMGISIKPASSIKDICSPYRTSINSFNHYLLKHVIFILLFVSLLARTIRLFFGGYLLIPSFCWDDNFFDNFVHFILFYKGFIKQYTSCW